MKLQAEHLMLLEEVKDKLCIKLRSDWESYQIHPPELYVVTGWDIVDIPEKKGIFGYPAYRDLKAIHVMQTKHIGTRFYGIFEKNLEHVLYDIRKDRANFIHLKGEIKAFGFEVKKTDKDL